MVKNKLDTRFFESTRGQIVTLMRGSEKTVNEMAEALTLTDNAIRAHLLSLERDGLVEQKGVVKGFRKPHHLYGLTTEARHLFPRPYASLFNRILGVLKRKLPPGEVAGTLGDVGHEIGSENRTNRSANIDERLGGALKALESLGGSAQIFRENDMTIIKSESCPFGEAVSEHPEVCKVAESMIEEIVGKTVTETCDRTSWPRCRFLIEAL
jgi:predicted ArsR family transcriptional regulator